MAALAACRGNPASVPAASPSSAAAAVDDVVLSAWAVVLRAATPLPTISGLAPIEGESYLAVHDARGGTAKKGRLTDRLSVLAVAPTGEVARAPVSLEVGPIARPRDLEAIAAVPGAPRTFLLLESGGGGRSRRLFTCELATESSGEQVARLVAPPLELRPYTSGLENVESLCVLSRGEDPESLELLVADRGGVPASDEDEGSTATIVRLVRLTIRNGDVVSSRPLAMRGPLLTSPVDTGEERSSWRIASDLMIAPDGALYLSSADDPGPAGPYRSLLSRLGSFANGSLDAAETIVSVRIADHKVEAICAMDASSALADGVPGAAGGWQILAGSDDEERGGELLRIEPPGAARAAPRLP